jgi:hypothetical protein
MAQPGYLGSCTYSVVRAGVTIYTGSARFRNMDCEGAVTTEDTTPTGSLSFGYDTVTKRQANWSMTADVPGGPNVAVEGDPFQMEEGDYLAVVATGGRQFTGTVLVQRFVMRIPQPGVQGFEVSGVTQGPYYWRGYTGATA